MATLKRKYAIESVLVAFVVLVICVRRIALDPRVAVTTEQPPSARELAITAQIRDSALTFITDNQKYDHRYKRDAHPNAHGCVTAEFRVSKNLEPRFRQGVFATPGKSYPAWVRFSNGTQANDTKPDGRGMAIKLMGVPGEKLLPEQRDEQTQDFVMVNHHTFFLRDVVEYQQFFNRQVKGEQFGYFISWNPLDWHLREFRVGLQLLLKKTPSPIAATYFSVLPFKLGNALNVKFSVAPCDLATPDRCEPLAREMPKEPSSHYLREALVNDLSPSADVSGNEQIAARFQFRVQVQDPGQNMPIEDASIEWSEAASPYLPIAELVIPKQRFNSDLQNQFCEELSFTPWHALPEHRPIGGLNRSRRVVYEAIAEKRHSGNGVVRREPRNFDISSATLPTSTDRERTSP